MSLPFLSAICLEYGRPDHLTESVACFLQQDYAGEHELVILNSFSKIKYSFDHPRVRIINLDVRPESLGCCRNLAIEHARGTHILTWDADDLFLPHFLTTVGESFGDNSWVHIGSQFYTLGGIIKNIVPGSANLVAFKKTAWEAVGKYNKMGCGEDRNFIGRLTAQTPGQKIPIPPEKIGFLYCWGNNIWHISGKGDDAPGSLASYKRSERELRTRVANRQVKTGNIVLQPKLKRDYSAMAKAFIGVKKPAPTPAKSNLEGIGVLMLGRAGDIINFLPVLKLINDSFSKPHLVVSKAFASLLDGVSYVTPFPVELEHNQLSAALTLAKQKFRHVIQAQAWGEGCPLLRNTAAFNIESWHRAGFGHLFHDKSLRPVFDLRSKSREDALWNKLNISDKPMMLVKLHGGVSSPLPFSDRLLAEITTRFGEQFNIVNLHGLRSERIYDLLGIYDRAALLCCIDSAPLHLAGASDIPVVALVNPGEWLGSFPRCNCVARITYTEAIENPVMVLDAVSEALKTQ